MPFDYDEEARIITISLLDFFQQNTIERLKDFVWKKPERVAFESPLKSLISYSYTINSVIENLMRSMGKESYSVSKDLITIDEIMSLLWIFYRQTLEESIESEGKKFATQIRNETRLLTNKLIANYDDLSFAEKIVKEKTEQAKTKSESFFYIISLGCHIFEAIDTVTGFRTRSHDTEKITRTIEFPEQYIQSGMALLNYFGTILRKKQPNNKAKVRIEQEGLKVTLIIEDMNGESEIIEETLNEYGLVLAGNIPLDDYTDDRLFYLELKNELRMACLRIQHLEELLEYKGTSERNLFNLLDKSIQSNKSINLDINVSPTSSSSSTAIMPIASLLTRINDTFERLGRLLGDSQETSKNIDDVVKEIDKIKNKHDKEEIAKSSAFSAIRSFLDKFKAAENTIDTTLESGRKTVNLVKKIAKYYNEVADLCGCPRVPSIFLKD